MSLGAPEGTAALLKALNSDRVLEASSAAGVSLKLSASNGLYIDIPVFTANIVWREAKLSPELVKGCALTFTEGASVIRSRAGPRPRWRRPPGPPVAVGPDLGPAGSAGCGSVRLSASPSLEGSRREGSGRCSV